MITINFKNNLLFKKLCRQILITFIYLQVIQYRSRENTRVNFNTTWDVYKNGFGDVHQNYWLGTL